MSVTEFRLSESRTPSFTNLERNIRPRSKKPAVKGGAKLASRDKDMVIKYFQRHPAFNFGVATGAVSNLVVIDVDGAEGEKSLRALKQIYPTAYHPNG